MNESDILKLIRDDVWMIKVLEIVQGLNLPDWMIGAGFIRGKVWDVLHRYTERTPLEDIDVIYFDPTNTEEVKEKELEKILKNKMDEPWSIKNQARMHLVVKRETPYTSSKDALAHWVETPTCIAATLDKDDNLKLIAPHGIDDLVNLVLRPSPLFTGDIQIFKDRIEKKQWQSKWPKLKIIHQTGSNLIR